MRCPASMAALAVTVLATAAFLGTSAWRFFVAADIGSTMAWSIPVIDVSAWVSELQAQSDLTVHDGVVAQLDHALSEFGFAVVIGHGVDDEAFNEVYRSAQAFFHSDAKHEYNLQLGYGFGGYLPAGYEAGGQLAGERNPQGDLVESLTCRGLHHSSSRNASRTSADPHFAQDMSDIPSADRIPPELRGPTIALHDKLLPFKTLLTRTTERVMGVAAGAFNDTFDPRRGGIRFPFYPSLPTFAEKTIGYGAHADSGGMVVLRVDRHNPVGTEVLYRGQWLPVPVHLPNAVVLNGGTVLQRLTGGRWKAAIHRAARANTRERLSIVYGAMVPHNDLEVSSLAVAHLRTAATATGENQEKVVRVKEYLDARVRMQRPEMDPRDRELIAYVDGC